VSVKYFINPKLKLVLYVCVGALTGQDFLSAVTEAARELGQSKERIDSIIDALDAYDELDLEDMKQATHVINNEIKDWDYPTKVAVYTMSKGVILLAEAITIISIGNLNLHGFSNIRELINWLELSGMEEELISFWIEARSSLQLASDTLNT